MASKRSTRLAVAFSVFLIIAVACGAMALGAGSRDTKTFALGDTTRIEIRSGSTGNTAQMTDMDEMQIVREFFDNELIKAGSSKDRTGWGYRLTFYNGEDVTEEITVMSENRINDDGYFWEAEHGFLPTDVFARLLGEMPTVQIFVYDDTQGGACYVMYEDNAAHTREEIMAAQTVTLDEINALLAKFTGRFDYEIRAMDRQGYDMARLDQIRAALIFPEGVDHGGVISYFDEPNIGFGGAPRTSSAPQTAENTLWAGFNAVVLNLFQADPGLNGDISVIALDPNGIPEDAREPLISVLTGWARDAHGCQLLIATLEELVEQGYVTITPLQGSDGPGFYEFKDGVLFSFSNASLTGDTLTVDASKWRTSLGAVGASYTAQFTDGNWTVETPEQMWMS
jgi:hypothetical protein